MQPWVGSRGRLRQPTVSSVDTLGCRPIRDVRALLARAQPIQRDPYALANRGFGPKSGRRCECVQAIACQLASVQVPPQCPCGRCRSQKIPDHAAELSLGPKDVIACSGGGYRLRQRWPDECLQPGASAASPSRPGLVLGVTIMGIAFLALLQSVASASATMGACIHSAAMWLGAVGRIEGSRNASIPDVNLPRGPKSL